MTQHEIDLIVDSFALVLKRKDAGLEFYKRLFGLAPELRTLFKGDIDDQARKLTDTLATAVGKLHDLTTLDAALRDLGARHRAFGARQDHYTTVGMALILTFEALLGDRFDAATRQAWLLLYSRVSNAMIAGAAESAAGHAVGMHRRSL